MKESLSPNSDVQTFYQNLQLKDIFGQKPLAYEIAEEEYTKAWTWYEEKGKKRRGGSSRYFDDKISPEAQRFGIKWPDVTYIYPGGKDIKYHVREHYKSHKENFLSWWIPSQKERELLLSLANFASGDHKPTIVDVACGSGLSLNLLALNTDVTASGIDPQASEDNEFTSTIPFAHNATMKKVDVWDTIDQLGPKYNVTTTKKRERLLRTIRKRVDGEERPIIQTFGDVPDFQTGDPKALNDEVGQLQILANSFITDTSVDLALCSFMPLHKELTIPIRDGIFPKAIAYVIPTNSRSGAGEYYSYMDSWNYDRFINDKNTKEWVKSMQLNDDSVISFHPGRNYQTIAQWYTPSKLIWEAEYWKKEEFQKVDKYCDDPKEESAKVVIQLRKDVAQNLDLTRLTIPKYSFDEEFDQYLNSNESGDFGQSLDEVYNTLLKK